MNGNSRRTTKGAVGWQGDGTAGWWSQLHVVYKREREEARERRRGGTLLEINRNVTIFQQPLPVPRASFSGIFLRPAPRFPTRPLLVSLFIPVADTEEKTETREHRVVTCAERWKKRRARFQRGRRRWQPLCTYKGTKQVAGVTVKNRRLCGRTGAARYGAAKGRNEPSR